MNRSITVAGRAYEMRRRLDKDAVRRLVQLSKLGLAPKAEDFVEEAREFLSIALPGLHVETFRGLTTEEKFRVVRRITEYLGAIIKGYSVADRSALFAAEGE